MELTFRAAAPAERLYIAKQSTQIEGQTGSVGHLQADMGEDGLSSPAATKGAVHDDRAKALNMEQLRSGL